MFRQESGVTFSLEFVGPEAVVLLGTLRENGRPRVCGEVREEDGAVPHQRVPGREESDCDV